MRDPSEIIKEQGERISQLMTENSKVAGQISAAHGVLDAYGVDKVKPLALRTKLFGALYGELQAEAHKLRLLLKIREEKE